MHRLVAFCVQSRSFHSQVCVFCFAGECQLMASGSVALLRQLAHSFLHQSALVAFLRFVRKNRSIADVQVTNVLLRFLQPAFFFARRGSSADCSCVCMRCSWPLKQKVCLLTATLFWSCEHHKSDLAQRLRAKRLQNTN